ncbi:hypothetical protein P775_08120 [Puniceibacterium antarcticum]|uniref:Exonuclease domain-containing protein n=1 Tax=Puniceibacterium antarcticum TaxID=1206336 RepID=A0A2G8RFX7_9RHOB|nr:3'-5' exonuclease [Puniceibacterium antarcticum]PIL20485.1 hypothetical protein P775_08120 [Puniceibacterium antarcticum]
MTRRSTLRVRVFQGFAVLALALVAALRGVLWMVGTRIADQGVEAGFTLAAQLGTATILLLCFAVWLYFDERIAKPLERQSDTAGPHDPAPVFGPEEMAQQDTRRMARAMALLDSDKSQLARLIAEMPSAKLVVNAGDQIVLYDNLAADLLAKSGAPRLGAKLSDYFNARTLAGARAKMQRTGLEVQFTTEAGGEGDPLNARMRPLEDGNALVILDKTEGRTPPEHPGPLVYDFALLSSQNGHLVEETPLSALTYVILSTETTGLLPHRDDLLQIGAVRMVGANILRRETLDLRIAPASGDDTERPEDGQMGPRDACAQLHDFASGAVIVAHNAPLRMAFLRHQANVSWENPQIDLVLLSALLFGDRADHSLRGMAARTGVGTSQGLARGGLAQAKLAAEVMQRMMPMLAARELDSLSRLKDTLNRHADSLESLH